MTAQRRRHLLVLSRVWAFPLWRIVQRAGVRDVVVADVDHWIECIDDDELRALNTFGRFAFLSGALTEFRTLLHFRLRGLPGVYRSMLTRVYSPEPTLTLDAESIGPGLFIQHGVASIITAESIGHHCWINQQVTIGHTAAGRPTLGDHVRVGAGAIVVGPITLHDGATVGVNATVIHDVGPGQTVVAPLAVPLTDDRRLSADPYPDD